MAVSAEFYAFFVVQSFMRFLLCSVLSVFFPLCRVCEHEVYIDKEIRSTFVYQILVHYDKEI